MAVMELEGADSQIARCATCPMAEWRCWKIR